MKNLPVYIFCTIVFAQQLISSTEDDEPRVRNLQFEDAIKNVTTNIESTKKTLQDIRSQRQLFFNLLNNYSQCAGDATSYRITIKIYNIPEGWETKVKYTMNTVFPRDPYKAMLYLINHLTTLEENLCQKEKLQIKQLNKLMMRQRNLLKKS